MTRWSYLTDAERAAVLLALGDSEDADDDPTSNILDDLHPAQRAFVADPAEHGSALCSRRAGKSHGIAARFALAQRHHPGGVSVYMAETVGKARELLWDGALAGLSHRYGLGAELWRPDNLYVRWPNGHRTWLCGFGSVAEIEKVRGLAIRGAAVVDEAQTCIYLDRLVQDVLEPACADYRTPLWLVGTPGMVPAGMLYRVTAGDLTSWSRHAWTIADNDRFPRWAGREDWREECERYLSGVRSQNNWTEATPAYQREYLGRWVEDAGNLVFPYDHARNGWDGALPDGMVTTVLGVDLATTGTTAFVVASIVGGRPETYLRHVETHTGASLPRVCGLAESLRQRYAAARVVVDAGGLGGAFVGEMRDRYRLPAEPAEKRDKAGFAYAMAGDLMAGNLRVAARECRPLLDEWAGLVWDDERTGWSDALPDHAADAALYAWRALRPYYRPEEEPPTPGTREWYAAEAEKRKAESVARVKARQKKKRR